MPKLTYKGTKVVTVLYESNVETGIPTGQVKPNIPLDPDYIADEITSPSCPDRELFSNSKVSQRFVKNNCNAGQSGTSVTYTVPEGRYIAFTQNQADELAQLDIFVYGQEYANLNGSCVTN